ncbi:hypothetical protein [Arthrobacter sp. zg-Y1116]|uniref:hypothetical protein n=1 Tax=Arthrobacter sp. zg-Y1116 TaxID=2964611 RepID=UPI002107EFFC|nr:hypothetical protein [Arthrobacter sp. zg-Y1116]MCQ1947779.1 hypothetical protein [Arthrobacter sp. zg-Y1116]
MNFLYSLATAATPAPEESLAPGVAAEDVTPGTLGFLFTLFVVIAIIFLIRDMTKRIRRVRYREQVLAAQEAAERDASGQPDASRTALSMDKTGDNPADRDTTWDHLR